MSRASLSRAGYDSAIPFVKMGQYERLALDLLESAFADRFVRDDSRIFSFGPDAGTGEVDGTDSVTRASR